MNLLYPLDAFSRDVLILYELSFLSLLLWKRTQVSHGHHFPFLRYHILYALSTTITHHGLVRHNHES